MNKKIFRSSLITALLVVTAAIVLIMGIIYEYFESQLKNELRSEASYIAAAIESKGTAYLDKIKDESERITIISHDDTVIADTEAEPSEMENHLDRDEVKKALKDGSGTSVRYSDTLTEKIVYYAVKMKDGNILRVSTKHYTVITILMELAQPIAVVLLLATMLSLWLSVRVSRSIVRPINQLDLEHPENNSVYEELSPLLMKITSQRKTINKQLKEAVRRQEEFRLITENISEGFILTDQFMYRI